MPTSPPLATATSTPAPARAPAITTPSPVAAPTIAITPSPDARLATALTPSPAPVPLATRIPVATSGLPPEIDQPSGDEQPV
ncbi:MAG TPA: pectate lyase, partial [Chloroflexota bacterium]